jgi:predicted transcriptional regulator
LKTSITNSYTSLITFSYNTKISQSIAAKERKIDMTYRSKMDIISKILQAANGGIAKTKIMYHAFLSHAQLQDYLRVLIQNDLISYDLDTHTFKTTEKGLRFIEIYNQMDGMIKAVEEEQQV